jgi:hypothetical protein
MSTIPEVWNEKYVKKSTLKMKYINLRNAGKTGLFVMVLSVFSCTKGTYDFDKLSSRIELNHKVAAPLAKGDLSIRNLVTPNDTVVFYGPQEDSVKLVYHSDSVFSYGSEDVFTIPDQKIENYNIYSNYPVPAAFLPDTVNNLDTVQFYQFSFNDGERLDSMVCNNGNIEVNVTSSFKHDGYLVITAPGILVGGTLLRDTVQLEPTGSNYTGSANIDLAGKTLVFEDTVRNSSKLLLVFNIVLFKTPGYGIDAGDHASIDFGITSIDFSEAYGYLGQKEIEIDTDSLDLNMDELDFLSGSFALTNPKVLLHYQNSFGLKAEAHLHLEGTFDSRSVPPSDAVLDVSGPHLPNMDTAATLILDKNNITNLTELLAFPFPKSIAISGNVLTNPSGDSTISNFITKNSRMTGNADIEIPLQFRADLVITDTMKIDLDNPDEIDYVDYADLYINVTNGFPVAVEATLTMYDSVSGTDLRTIDLGLIKAAPVNGNGIVIPDLVEPSEIKISLSQDAMDDFFKRANKVIIRGTLQTTQKDGISQDIKILTDYTLSFRIGADAKIHYITNLD